MRFKLNWFNPIRSPLGLLIDIKEAMKWMNDLEDVNPEYQKNVHKGNSALVGLLMQFVLLLIIIKIGASFFD